MASATYEYVVRDAAGKRTKGRLAASSEAALVARLRSTGLAPLSVKVAGQGLNREISLPGSQRVSTKDLAVMSRQFATMIGSGLSLLRSLGILAAQTENKVLAGLLDQVRGDLEQGRALSSSMAKHPRVFPPLMINMVRAGEVGGFLDTALTQVADNAEAEAKLQAKVRSAMAYPVVVFVIALLAVAGMLLFIVPVFANMFTELGADLPAPTQFLVTLSGLMRYLAPVLLVLAVVGSVVWARVRHRPRVRDVVDPLKLRLPVFGGLARKIAISRLTRNLGTMVSSGVPILQALDIVADTSGNAVVARAVRASQMSVRSGESIAAPLSLHPVIPPMVTQMMAVGEETGALDVMLGKVSDFYDREVEATTDALTSLIEPLMIAFLGIVVGGMIVALYMPIFTVFNAIQ
jgi:type IV pilus assembly protein PilC